ncbi:ABC transporter ATP-binding protein [Alkalicoccobacillus plakortidis]|uniref:Quaternary amine transport ATP-binding protein n=1 Tax=Alkalicoccobacillus plakortidis TaxID=444060 RepID=A0ABT0XP28_9BACI|nr:betaine/proline/choline family ABC transporter ATP-binding protein [Alkalicoccobacillus plakortidis]MCM2677009.1 betaine/proline/choline family ABC transporter ATP-binding protein [Alkalicoccobacillus plakortidis]
MLTFDHVVKKYTSEVTAVKDVSFEVKEGEIVIFLGPSGCGKTTLLRMVNRLETMTEGDIKINGKSINELNEIELRRQIGYVIQSNGLFPNMTIEENVVIVPDLLGWSQKKKRARYNELMKLIGLDPDEFRKRHPNELSGGQQQRIGVARALAADPPVMLMDEPFGALDPLIRERIQDEFLQIQREVKKTILFVSHDIDEAIKMADKIVLMRDGEIMQFGSPSDILINPANEYVSSFIGKDRAIKHLSLHTIAELEAEIGLVGLDQSVEDSKTVHVNADLRNTLAMLLNQEADQIVVLDDNDQEKGAITIDLVQKYLHLEMKVRPKTKKQSEQVIT